MRIPTPPHFAFEQTVESHGWYRLAPFRWSRRDGVMRRAEVIGGKAVELSITFDGDALNITGARDSAELRTKMTRMFQLGVDTSEFVSMTRGVPTHDWVARSGFGRLLCGSTLFEDVVKIIATTNTMWKQTVRMTELLVEKCGKRTRLNHAAFPEPLDIVRFRPDELQLDCRLGYRAGYIHTLAKGIIDGSINIDQIVNPAQPTEELFASYRTLPGIGPYGAAHLLAMDGRHDFIAVDTEFRRFVRERYHNGRTVTDKAMLRRYARWGRWKYLAYWSELWSSVADRLQPAAGEDK